MITLCMLCNTVTGVDFKEKAGLSHGICIECMPGYMRQSKMPEEEIEAFMKKYKRREVFEVYKKSLH